jgi:hypothetical protein
MILLWLDINSSYAHSSLCLPALHAQYRAKEWQWYAVSGTLTTPYTHFIKEAVRLQPQVVAATAWLFNHNRLLEVVSRIKAILPSTYVLLGGPEFLGDNENYLKANRYVDALFRGEGEEVFPLWLDLWDQKKERDRLTGICYIDNHGVYHDSGTAKVSRFHELHPPEYSPFFLLDKPFIQIETSRGCFNGCYFCVSGGDKPVKNISVEQLRGRLQQLINKGVKEIRILDRTFNADPKRATSLLSLFMEFSGLFRFHIEIHPAFLNTELIDTLQNIPKDLLHIEAGVQSLDDHVISASGRIGNSSKTLQGLSRLKACNRFEIHADLVAGLPKYTPTRLKEDVIELISLELDEIQLELLKVLPGTKMCKEAISMGIVYAPTPPYEVVATPNMTPEMLHEAQQLSRLLDGWYNGHSDWRKPFVQLTLGIPCFLDHFLHHLMQKQLLEQPLSMERRGILLWDFCFTHYPASLPEISVAWITAGYSLKKAPGLQALSYKIPNNSHPEIKFYQLPNPSGDYWFGFNRKEERRKPCIILRKSPE